EPRKIGTATARVCKRPTDETAACSLLLVRNLPIFKNRAARPDNPAAIGRDEKQSRKVRARAEFDALPRRAAVCRVQQQSAVAGDPPLHGALRRASFRFQEDHVVEVQFYARRLPPPSGAAIRRRDDRSLRPDSPAALWVDEMNGA